MHFFVFSFNRGDFLENCVASIERCAPGHPVTVFDDDSNDEATRQVLGAIGNRHRVLCPSANGPESKHGGLYGNMQAALEIAASDELLCYLQDDMQLVRSVTADDIDAAERYFERCPDAGFMQPAFLKGSNRRSDRAQMRIDAKSGGYFADRLDRSAGAYYSDVFISRAARLHQSGWHFRNREAANELQARQRFRQMVYLRNPFAAWLPQAPAWRGKRMTLALRLGQRAGRCGLYPFDTLGDEEARAFTQRETAILPFAEDFLSVGDADLPRPWTYHPLQGRRMLKLLNSIELKIRKPFQ